MTNSRLGTIKQADLGIGLEHTLTISHCDPVCRHEVCLCLCLPPTFPTVCCSQPTILVLGLIFYLYSVAYVSLPICSILNNVSEQPNSLTRMSLRLPKICTGDDTKTKRQDSQNNKTCNLSLRKNLRSTY